MKKSDITYIVSAIFTSLFVVFYCCTYWFHIKLPHYYPLQHTWKWAKERGVPSQGWYGIQAFAFLAAAIVVLLVYFIVKLTTAKEAKLNPAFTRSLGAITALVILACMAYISFHEFSKWGVF